MRTNFIRAFGVLLGVAALVTMCQTPAGTKSASRMFEARADERESHEGCSVRSARGGFGLTLTGKAAGYGDVSGVGTATLDGNGNFSGNTTGTVTVGSLSTVFTSPVTGTYTVNRDCGGVFVINFVNLHVSGSGVVSFTDGGNAAAFLITSPSSAQLSGTARHQ